MDVGPSLTHGACKLVETTVPTRAITCRNGGNWVRRIRLAVSIVTLTEAFQELSTDSWNRRLKSPTS